MALKLASEVDPRRLIGARVRAQVSDASFSMGCVYIVSGVELCPPWEGGRQRGFGLLIAGKCNDGWAGKVVCRPQHDGKDRWPIGKDASWVAYCFEVVALSEDWDE